MELYGYEIVRESDLAHYGIKGMKWGVRKATTTSADVYGDGRHTTAVQYNRRTHDQIRFGDAGYERIRKRLDKGKSYKAAVRAEKGRRKVMRMSMTLGALAVYDLAAHEGRGIKNTAKVAKTAAILAKMKIGKAAAYRAAYKAAHTVWDVDLGRFVTI